MDQGGVFFEVTRSQLLRKLAESRRSPCSDAWLSRSAHGACGRWRTSILLSMLLEALEGNE